MEETDYTNEEGLMCVYLISDTCGAGSDEWCSSPASEEAIGSDCVWTRLFGPVQVGSMILLAPLTQLSLSVKCHLHHNNCESVYCPSARVLPSSIAGKSSSDDNTEVDLNEQNIMLKCVCICVCQALLYLEQSLSPLKRCVQCWAWLVYRKCRKKTVVEGVGSLISLLFSSRKRSGLCEVTMIVFVNQMLLMIAGDVEPNPGPGVLISTKMLKYYSRVSIFLQKH